MHDFRTVQGRTTPNTQVAVARSGYDLPVAIEERGAMDPVRMTEFSQHATALHVEKIDGLVGPARRQQVLKISGNLDVDYRLRNRDLAIPRICAVETKKYRFAKRERCRPHRIHRQSIDFSNG